MSIHGKPSSTPKTLISILRPVRLDMALPHSDMLTSKPSPMNSGKREAVQTDLRKKTGSMPQKNCDPALTPVDPVLGITGVQFRKSFKGEEKTDETEHEG